MEIIQESSFYNTNNFEISVKKFLVNEEVTNYCAFERINILTEFVPGAIYNFIFSCYVLLCLDDRNFKY